MRVDYLIVGSGLTGAVIAGNDMAFLDHIDLLL